MIIKEQKVNKERTKSRVTEEQENGTIGQGETGGNMEGGNSRLEREM